MPTTYIALRQIWHTAEGGDVVYEEGDEVPESLVTDWLIANDAVERRPPRSRKAKS